MAGTLTQTSAGVAASGLTAALVDRNGGELQGYRDGELDRRRNKRHGRRLRHPQGRPGAAGRQRLRRDDLPTTTVTISSAQLSLGGGGLVCFAASGSVAVALSRASPAARRSRATSRVPHRRHPRADRVRYRGAHVDSTTSTPTYDVTVANATLVIAGTTLGGTRRRSGSSRTAPVSTSTSDSLRSRSASARSPCRAGPAHRRRRHHRLSDGNDHDRHRDQRPDLPRQRRHGPGRHRAAAGGADFVGHRAGRPVRSGRGDQRVAAPPGERLHADRQRVPRAADPHGLVRPVDAGHAPRRLEPRHHDRLGHDAGRAGRVRDRLRRRRGLRQRRHGERRDPWPRHQHGATRP